MTGHIYLIRNITNGKGYVGQTSRSVISRFKDHVRNANSGLEYALSRAIRKHGISAFTVLEVATCPCDLLDDLEKHYIKFYGTYAFGGHGYNMTEGGDSPSRPKGARNSDESKAKNSATHKGMKRPPRSDEWKAKQSVTQSMKTLSHETKVKISEKLKGKKKPRRSAEHIAAISASKKGQNLGVPWSAARRAAHKKV